MTSPATVFTLSEKSQQAILELYRQCRNMHWQQWNLRYQMQQIDKQYIREYQDSLSIKQRKNRLLNDLGDSSAIQNVIIPVVMPAVRAAVTYQMSVFCSGNPMFGVVASPENIDAAKQMEAIIENQQQVGCWVREFLLNFTDGFKYNMSALHVPWERRVVPNFDTEFTTATGAPLNGVKLKDTIWEGNVIKRWDLYNTFWDTRCPLTSVHTEGEFVGTSELKSRIALKKFINELQDKMIQNLKAAYISGVGTVVTADSSGVLGTIYMPRINPDCMIDESLNQGTNWESWAGINRNDTNGFLYRNSYVLTTFYARILPSDFGIRVPNQETPQVWKFYLVNDAVIIYAERQTNAHGFLPVIFGQPNEDGLGYQTKSLAKNVVPYQQVSTALMNGVLAARRRAVNDRLLYDPSRVTEANINSANPSAKIPVRPSAYGKSLSEAVYAFPYRDDTSVMSLQEIPLITQMAQQLTGQNPVKQGQFVKGNKTTREYDTVMANANAPDQMTALLLEDQQMMPIKHILKTNILQYQGGASLFSKAKKEEVKIDPVKLRQATLEFKVSDGLIPSEKLIDGDTLAVAFQQIGSSPQINSGYNVAPLFSYLMKTQGADLSPFEKSPEQIAYETAVAQWQALTLEIAKTGSEKFPPQPLPQQYGYDLARQGPSVPGPAKTEQRNIINNITNNELRT